jgi:hypothetical protein
MGATGRGDARGRGLPDARGSGRPSHSRPSDLAARPASNGRCVSGPCAASSGVAPAFGRSEATNRCLRARFVPRSGTSGRTESNCKAGTLGKVGTPELVGGACRAPSARSRGEAPRVSGRTAADCSASADGCACARARTRPDTLAVAVSFATNDATAATSAAPATTAATAAATATAAPAATAAR